MLDDVHGDDLSTLLALVVGRLIPWLLVADVHGEVAGLSSSCSGSTSSRAAVGAPSPALFPLDLKLRPLALHGGLDLEDKREPCFHMVVRNDPGKVYARDSWSLSEFKGCQMVILISKAELYVIRWWNRSS